MSDDHVDLSEDEVMKLFAAADPAGDEGCSGVRRARLVRGGATGRASLAVYLGDVSTDDEHESRRTRRTLWLATAASLLGALIVGVIAVGTQDDDRVVPAEQTVVTTPVMEPDPTVAPDPTPAPNVVDPSPDPDPENGSESIPVGTGDVSVDGAVTADSAPETTAPETEPILLDRAGSELIAGQRYSSLNLGVDVEFTLPRDDLVLAFNRASIVSLIDGFADNGYYPPETGVALDLRRWAGWSTRNEAALPTPTASIDPYAVDEWIAANDIVLLSDETREIGGKSARVFDVTVDPLSEVQAATGFQGGCFPGWEPCFHMGADASGDDANRFDWVSAERITRFYLLTIEGSEPLLISVGAAPGSTWFDEIESTFIESLEIGPDRPPVDVG